jgi:hypothetical protein
MSLNGPMLIPVPISVYQRDSLQQVTVHCERFAGNGSFIDARRGSKLSIHSQLTGDWLTLTAALIANASQPTPASQPIDRAPHSTRAPRQDVCIHHRCADVRVAQELLYGPDIVPGLEQMRRE